MTAVNEFYSPLRPNDNNDSDTAVAFEENNAEPINIVVDDGSAFCRYCGNRLEQGDVFCSKCGSGTNGQSAAQMQQQTQPQPAQYSYNNYNQPQQPYPQQNFSRGGNAFDNRTMGNQFGTAPTVINNNYYNSGNTMNYNSHNTNTNVDMSSYAPGMKNKTVSLILCILFGWCGAHRYYEGKIATGILWTLTAGIGGLGWLIDFLILLFKPKWYKP